MLRLNSIIVIVPLLFSHSSFANFQETDQEFCAQSLFGTHQKTKRKFAKEAALRRFNADAATVVRYIDSTDIISEVRRKSPQKNVFVVAIRYRYQVDILSPVAESLYEVVIWYGGRYTVKFMSDGTI